MKTKPFFFAILLLFLGFVTAGEDKWKWKEKDVHHIAQLLSGATCNRCSKR